MKAQLPESKARLKGKSSRKRGVNTNRQPSLASSLQYELQIIRQCLVADALAGVADSRSGCQFHNLARRRNRTNQGCLK